MTTNQRPALKLRILALWLPIWLLSVIGNASDDGISITLASNGSTEYSIVSAGSSSIVSFASFELQKYLTRISGSHFNISDALSDYSIVVGSELQVKQTDPGMEITELTEEEYWIGIRDRRVYLIGGSDRAVLSAVYGFLTRLGCRWVAPDFQYFSGSNQYIPNATQLSYKQKEDVVSKPALTYRKLYIEEGRSHNLNNLKQLIDWMPKANFNVLVAPINYRGRGQVMWDNWRISLIPELKKRGITIEVGGHGYQNFLHPAMENGRIFEEHPQWFGKDSQGNRSRDDNMVFCTSNTHAVRFMHLKLLEYLEKHPEIDILDFWPPDSEHWCRCSECKAMGSASDRHAILVNQTVEFLQKEKPQIRLECLAYSRYTEPPEGQMINNNALLDFCPIRQNFEYQIYEEASSNNKFYKEALLSWLHSFQGDISVYSYYRKYAWRSLPNIIPHYMQRDLKFYKQVGVKGISVYSEPADWFTYGLNHFVLGQLAWDPEVEVDSLINEYCKVVYESAADLAVGIYHNLEEIVRFGCSIPHSTPKSSSQYKTMAAKLSDSKQELSEAGATFSNKPDIQDNLDRLLLMLDYAQKSITSKDLTENGGSEEAKMKATEDAKELISKHPDTGVFLSYYNTSQPAQKPNVVLIVADDLGYGDLSCYGATKISTPAIDQLAAEGMKFQHAYVTSSLCSPSRYSLLTGQYNWRSRLEWGVVKSFEKPLIQENQTTMANLFRRNGYRTLCIGKWHLGLEWEVNNSAPPDPEQSVFNSWATNLQDYIDFSSQIGGGPIERGFDYFYGMAGSNNMQPYVLIENDQVLQPPTEEQKPYDHYVDALRAANWDIKTINQDLTEKAVEAIDYHFTSFPDEPLFFYFPTSAIHRPCLPTFTKGKSKAGLRGDIVVELDWTVNQVVNALKRNGEYENTILVFISDNGPRPGDPALWMEEYQFGEYDDFHESYFDNYQPEYINENGNKIWKKGWYTYDHRASGELLGFKSDSWEGGLKVPFIVRWPNHIQPGSVNTNMVCAVDLLSTFAELLGDELRETEAEDSYSFLSNLLDKNAPQVRKSLVLSGGASGALAVIQDDWKYIQAAPPGRWPETFYPQGPSKSDTQLYYLSEDRQEQQNLYNTEQAKVIELQGLIERIKQKPGIENE